MVKTKFVCPKECKTVMGNPRSWPGLGRIPNKIFMFLSSSSAAKSLQLCPTLCDPRDSRDSPGKNTGVGCHFLLQCMKVKSECEFSQ